MKIFETPVLSCYRSEDSCYGSGGVPLACADIIHELWDIPKGSKIQFAVYTKRASNRWLMHIEKGANRYRLRVGEWALIDLYYDLERILRNLYEEHGPKMLYVECLIT